MVCMASNSGVSAALARSETPMAIPAGTPRSRARSTDTITTERVCMATDHRPNIPTVNNSTPGNKVFITLWVKRQANKVTSIIHTHQGTPSRTASIFKIKVRILLEKASKAGPQVRLSQSTKSFTYGAT